MRLVLPYSRAALHDVQRDATSLPRNISADLSPVAIEDKFSATFRLYQENPEINSAILIDPLWHKPTQEVDTLHRIANGRIIGAKIVDPNSFSAIYDRLKGYFKSRAEGIKFTDQDIEPYLPCDDEVALIAKNIYQDSRVVMSGNPGQLVSITTTYTPTYGNENLIDAWLNPHIDQSGKLNYDQRVVHTQEALATVSFSNSDFILNEDDALTGNNRWSLSLRNEGKIVNGWSGPEGSYTVMRTPSAKNINQGILPTVHAHGPIRECDRRRWTSRFDIKLA